MSARINTAALGLPSLALNRLGDWEPAQHYRGGGDDSIEAWTEPIIERGLRPLFEKEQVLHAGLSRAPAASPHFDRVIAEPIRPAHAY